MHIWDIMTGQVQQIIAMTLNGDYYTYTYTIPADAENINFVFTDAAQDNWDSNSGINWHIPLTHTKNYSNPLPNQSLEITFSDLSQSGSLYWYVETNGYPQVTFG